MTNLSAQPATASPTEPTLTQLIPMYQGMQAILAYPPSPELNDLVIKTLERTTDPLMVGFLNLLITGDQGHRDLAAQIFHQLEVKIVEARQKQAQATAAKAAALVEASPLVSTLVKTLDPPTDAIESMVTPTHDELMAAWARNSAELPKVGTEGDVTRPMQPSPSRDPADTPDAILDWHRQADELARIAAIQPLREVPLAERQREDLVASEALEEPAANIVTLNTRREPTIAPYVTQEGEHYVLRYSGLDGKVTKEETYSILTMNTQFADSPETVLHQLRGVIIGINGQSTIEHGFGYVLPLEGMELLPSDKSLHIPLRLEYPTAMPIYDDHNAANVSGLKEFMALHETLRKGYTVCMDLYVKVNAHPSRGHSLTLSMQREKLILRRQVTEKGFGADGAMFSSQDLEDLHLALKKLELVGILASHVTR